MQWATYILLCADGSFYVGHTEDVQKRLATHDTGKGARYTANRSPRSLPTPKPTPESQGHCPLSPPTRPAKQKAFDETQWIQIVSFPLAWSAGSITYSNPGKKPRHSTNISSRTPVAHLLQSTFNYPSATPHIGFSKFPEAVEWRRLDPRRRSRRGRRRSCPLPP